MPNDEKIAPVVPLIVRGDLAHYRFLARTADVDTLRGLVMLMADDLEEALEIAFPAHQTQDGDQSG